MNNRRATGFLPGLGALILLVAGPGAFAQDATYTLDADFDLGTLVNVNHDAPNTDQLQINTTTSTFPVLWIANAGEDTVSRIDTDNDCEEGRYETWFFGNHLNNAFAGPAPSRTAVDANGNVYVANRHFDGKPPSVMKILLNGGIDRNGNGVIDTSTDANGDCIIDRTDPDEFIPLVDNNPANGILDPAELLDERVAWVVQLPADATADLGRSLCIAPNGNIWAGTFQGGSAYYQLSPVNGAVISGPHYNQNSNYGCLVDSAGILYGANLGFNLAILDTNNPASFSNPGHGTSQNYGIALDATHVYLAGLGCCGYVRYNKSTGVFDAPAAVNVPTRGISVDGNGDIVLGTSTIYKFDAATGNVIWSSVNPAGFSDTRGVIVDSNNNIWVVNKNSNNVTKFAADGTFLATVPVGNQPYTYSDATGLAFVSSTGSGFWNVTNDGGSNDIEWNSVSWNTEPEAFEPPGTSITVGARADNDPNALPILPFTPLTNGASPTGLSGRYIEVRATLTAAPDGTSPVLSDLSIAAVPDESACDMDEDGDVDRNDIKMIYGLRNTQVDPPGTPPDLDGDGTITVLDARICVLQCDIDNCAEPVTRGKPGGREGK